MPYKLTAKIPFSIYVRMCLLVLWFFFLTFAITYAIYESETFTSQLKHLKDMKTELNVNFDFDVYSVNFLLRD